MANAMPRLSKTEWKQVSRIAAEIGRADCGMRAKAPASTLPGPIVRFACEAQRHELRHDTRNAALEAGLSETAADALETLMQAIAR